MKKITEGTRTLAAQPATPKTLLLVRQGSFADGTGENAHPIHDVGTYGFRAMVSCAIWSKVVTTRALAS